MPDFYIRVSPADQVQFIVSVSKKVSKKAVTRNTVKRRVRAVTRDLAKNLKPAKYLIVAKPGAENIKGEDLRSELLSLIRSIRN